MLTFIVLHRKVGTKSDVNKMLYSVKPSFRRHHELGASDSKRGSPSAAVPPLSHSARKQDVRVRGLGAACLGGAQGAEQREVRVEVHEHSGLSESR